MPTGPFAWVRSLAKGSSTQKVAANNRNTRQQGQRNDAQALTAFGTVLARQSLALWIGPRVALLRPTRRLRNVGDNRSASIDNVIAAVDIERLTGDQLRPVHREKSHRNANVLDSGSTH